MARKNKGSARDEGVGIEHQGEQVEHGGGDLIHRQAICKDGRQRNQGGHTELENQDKVEGEQEYHKRR